MSKKKSEVIGEQLERPGNRTTLTTSCKARKSLADISCVNYMNRDAKESANEEVEEDLKVYGITRDVFKSKWKGVNDSVHWQGYARHVARL